MGIGHTRELDHCSHGKLKRFPNKEKSSVRKFRSELLFLEIKGLLRFCSLGFLSLLLSYVGLGLCQLASHGQDVVDGSRAVRASHSLTQTEVGGPDRGINGGTNQSVVVDVSVGNEGQQQRSQGTNDPEQYHHVLDDEGLTNPNDQVRAIDIEHDNHDRRAKQTEVPSIHGRENLIEVEGFQHEHHDREHDRGDKEQQPTADAVSNPRQRASGRTRTSNAVKCIRRASDNDRQERQNDQNIKSNKVSHDELSKLMRARSRARFIGFFCCFLFLQVFTIVATRLRGQAFDQATRFAVGVIAVTAQSQEAQVLAQFL